MGSTLYRGSTIRLVCAIILPFPKRVSNNVSFFGKLKRRNVFRVGAANVVTSWLIIQLVETIFPAFGFGDGAVRNVVIVLGVGLLPALILTCAPGARGSIYPFPDGFLLEALTGEPARARRIAEAGFAWRPSKPIDFPLKTW